MSEAIHPGELTRAVWRAAWHRLDQSIQVGQCSRFWFDQSSQREIDETVFCFFNRASSVETVSEVRRACIVAIRHPDFGEIQAIDTHGLDYVISCAGGQQYFVNAEEEPGKIYDSPLSVADWQFHVLLKDLSSPLSELV